MPLPSMLAACLLLLPLLPAQAPGRDALPRKGTERSVRGTCSEALSRDLFRACDADDDDRLDVFEASDALEAVRSPRDSAGFKRLDGDRDGYVSWPEFDRTLRAVLQTGTAFRVHTTRPLTESGNAPRAATPIRQFLQLHDRNGNDGLDPSEVAEFLRQASLPPTLGTTLRQLDRDQDGRISEAELQPWFEQQSGKTLPLPTGAGSPLAPPWDASDKNHDGAIDAAELRSALRRLDPALDAWTAQLLAALDKDHDGVLRPAELPGPPPSGAAPGPLPKQAPVR